jgi:hypothetical protein
MFHKTEHLLIKTRYISGCWVEQHVQSKVLRTIVNAPFYVPNRVLHKDLNVPLFAGLASTRYKSFHSSFHLPDNPLVQALSSITLSQNLPRRLIRNWPRDFLREWTKVKCFERVEWYLCVTFSPVLLTSVDFFFIHFACCILL